ncbi:hypothetical protein Tco_0604889 [Tanacetum coccineum]
MAMKWSRQYDFEASEIIRHKDLFSLTYLWLDYGSLDFHHNHISTFKVDIFQMMSTPIVWSTLLRFSWRIEGDGESSIDFRERAYSVALLQCDTHSRFPFLLQLLDTKNTDKNSSFYDESIISESTSRNASMEAVSSSVFQSHVPRRSMSLQLRVNKPPLPNNTRVEPLVSGTQIDVPPRNFISLLNPNKYIGKYLKQVGAMQFLDYFRKSVTVRHVGSLYASLLRDAGYQCWYQLVYHLWRASPTKKDAFAILKAENDVDNITYVGFCEALRQLDFIAHPYCLSKEETKDLWV